MTNPTNTGSGSIAQGQGSAAAGERGIAIGGCVSNSTFITGDKLNAFNFYITVVMNSYNQAEEKKCIIRQLASRNHAHALDAAQVIVEKGWYKDGSLIGGKFTRANLASVNLYNANLSGADLSWANLEGAELIKVNFKGADLTHANLTGAWLVEADLREAVLTSTNLTNAKLLNAKLDGAKLVNTNIVETGFIWASFKGAKLEFANIMIAQTPVDYSNLLAPGFKGAVYDANTTFPKNFIPEAAGAFKMDD